ncbi:DUF1049 domain-containing protein [Metallibacterium sp.]|jgi:uncharacterized integral membrane protein|uniref:DUF1049 domain-containing protein n=1 Tax=Metallibacterium sp. TaxID=2940281 RepID=UPI0026215CCC|nr:DUF1049 domain-containing protein [Metallibacterium sp.]
MRFVIAALLLIFALLGAAFAALNGGAVHYDFLLVEADLPKGVTLLAVLVLGWLLGGLSAWLGLGARRRRKVSGRGQGDGQDAA